ncbi:sodium-dependent transporter [Clostridium cylindrosporum]|uniref:Transporter n=1 Tax=Clostridium cylindrosporum DSM 605 TaxID=1121307 RepID=A0A0J8DEP0_CLOCY|nr:sodium-dependent transporter [Clostridium cylindrosporum]KMT22653.1 Na+-dependent transporter of the SNF family [Clostridium cylindrosporum DSM 605]
MSDNQFSSRIGFILAAAGSAIGLGAIWKFPYIAGISGGGAFFFMFVIFTISLGLPLLLGEFIIGRKTGKDAIEAYSTIAPGTKWNLIGYLGNVTVFILLSFYSVIGGWILIYIFKGITGGLTDLSPQGYGELLGSVSGDPLLSIIAHLLFIVLNILVISKGVQSGIERASKIMMPALFVIFIIIIARSLSLENAYAGVEFLFKPDFTKITSQSILFALGQAFFTLSLGVSGMVTYSAYLPKNTNINSSAISIVSMNLFIIILSGLAIFPGVFSFGLKPDQGPALLFNVLPNVFSRIPFGTLFFIAFLVLFLFAALTSSFSMLEIIVNSITKGDNTKRNKWSWIIGLSIFAFGIPSALSFGALSDFTILGKTFFDLADFMVSNFLMPLGALLISIFLPLKMKKEELFSELSNPKPIKKWLFNTWYIIIKYIAPIAIIIVFLDSLGAFNFLKK